jgi:hypothetical protein
MDDNFGLGYAMGQDSGNNNGFGGDGSWVWLLLILALAGGFGFGGGFGGFGGGGFVNGALTRAELYDGFAIQNIDSAVRGVQQGICDSTYALNNTLMGGFHGVDNAICNLGYNVQSGFNQIGHQISDCCCTTQRAIDGVNYNMAKGFCDLGNVINMQTRDIIDNQNANYRGIMDFMVNEKLSSKDAQIAQLQGQISQLNQNAVIGARIDAAVAEVLRRTGNDCPTAAYLVQPPTPVNFPTNGCGTVQFGGYGNGCGCGGF